MDFRQNDRDGDKVNDYWRADVRGLYTIGGETNFIRLVELPAARADAAPTHSPKGKWEKQVPKSGYWFKSLRFADEKTLPKKSTNRYAFCTFPEDYDGEDTPTFIISHENVMYLKVLGPDETIDVWPEDPVAEGWKTRN